MPQPEKVTIISNPQSQEIQDIVLKYANKTIEKIKLENIAQESEKKRQEKNKIKESLKAREEVYKLSPVPEDLRYIKLFDYFDFSEIDRFDNEKRSKLNDIWLFFKEKTKSSNKGEILAAIKTKERKLGLSGIETTRLNRLWNYIQLLKKEEDIKKEKKAWER